MQQTSALSTEAASCTQRGEEPDAHLPSAGSEPGFTALRDEKHVHWRSRTASSLLKSVDAGQHWHHQGHQAFFQTALRNGLPSLHYLHPRLTFPLGPHPYLGSPSPPAWTLSPPHPAWCCCTRLCLCWPRMMWQCHVSSSECRCYRLNGFSLLKRFPLSADGACGKALDQPVGEWLEHVGLPQYESKFLLNGFDDLRFMVSHLQHVISEVASTLHHSVGPRVNPAAFVF
ncbi:hypothetical protein NQZ68_003513 [Dissostichus eleginoides]|nr:hypothetical protein NQZ68_003513 [Dissostichus eleginoides]